MPAPIQKGPFVFCHRMNRLICLKSNSWWQRWLFPVVGFLSLIWYLARVLPKPSRVTYPCQKVAASLASGFIGYIIAISIAALAWHKARENLGRVRYWLFSFFIAVAVLGAEVSFRSPVDRALAWTPSDPPNSPMGVAKGIYPGRVAWMRDTNATPWNGITGHWWDDTTGINQGAVDRMMSRTLRGLTGAASDSEAWDKIFRYFNTTHNRGNVGYRAGEKIAIKVNFNNTTNYGDTDNSADASPQSVLALLRQLVNRAGVPQNMITVYEAPKTSPRRVIPDRCFNKWKAEFPNAIYADCTGINGRTAIAWTSNVINYSVNNGCGRDIPTCVYQATYVINMSLLKGHGTAGVTLTAKNHYGSINVREHTFIDCDARPMGTYSPFVDLIGHPHLGGKTILFMIDGLYGVRSVGDSVGTSFGAWRNLFGGQWSASYFMSQDPVAIDSVGLDFLRSEFAGNLGNGASSNCDNYLHEAANAYTSTNNYTQGGRRLPSLGVHEHWNNATDKQYSRNLGRTNGIELVALHQLAAVTIAITNPPNGAIFWAGTNILIRTTATIGYSSIQKVDFYANGRWVGSDTMRPYSVTWLSVGAGSYALTAKALDNLGAVSTSSPVNITVVVPSGINLALASRGSTITGNNGANWSKLIDGVKTGYTASAGFGYMYWTNAANAPGKMMLDLKGTCTIARIKLLLWDRDNRFYRYKIESSGNNTTWTTNVNRTAATNRCRSWQDIPLGSPLRARYLRLTGTYNSSNQQFHVVEWEVYGIPSAPVILTSANAVMVPENGTATFQVKFNIAPTRPTTMTISRVSGDADISVQSGASLVLNATHWNIYKTVTLRAAKDVDTVNSLAVIRCSAPGLANKDVTATEMDKTGLTNLALATRGSTITGSNGTNWNHLIDGISTGYTPTNGYGYTVWTNAPGVMTLDLKSLCRVSGMRLLLWDLDSRYYRYKIEASMNRTSWTLVTVRTNGEFRSWQNIIVNPVIRARYLRLTGRYCSSNAEFRVVEWEVYGRVGIGAGSGAVASSFTVSASTGNASALKGNMNVLEPINVRTSDPEPDTKGWKAVDGNLETFWQGQPGARGWWFALTYGKDVKAQDVQVRWAEGSATNLVLLGSADADRWYELAPLLKQGPVSFGYLWLMFPESEAGATPKVSEIRVDLAE